MASFNLSDISKYRSQIMGFAMIWVILYHYQIEGYGLAYIMGNGFTGVDLFMFVSGFGLFYSFEKDSDVIHFYKKRLLRVLPQYYLIGLIYELLGRHFDLLDYLWKYSTLGFWTDGNYAYGWFIPAIIALYFLYPFMHRTLFCKKLDKPLMLITVGLIFFFSFYIAFVRHKLMDTDHFLMLYRLPIFLLGMTVAYWVKNGYSKRSFLTIALVMLPLYVIHYTRIVVPVDTVHIKYLSTTFLAPILLVVLCVLFNKIRVINHVLGGVGNASLEIFMLHSLPMVIIAQLHITLQYPILTKFIICGGVCLLGIIVHYFWNKLISHLL